MSSLFNPSPGQYEDRDADLEEKRLYALAEDIFDEALHHHLICALWSTTGTDGEPLDKVYSVDDFAPETRAQLKDDLDDFIKSNMAIIEANNMSPAQVGHDFWLTRNGHGAGFWDRGLGADGDELTKASKVYGGMDLYIGDDGLVHH